MKEGDRVRITDGKDKGKTGRIQTIIPAEDVMEMGQPGEMHMGGARTICIVELDDEDRAELLVEAQLEVIKD